jgi:pilus assembly protein Flp/PilA
MMLKMMVMFQQAWWRVKNQKGAVAIEYALLAALIALVLAVGAGILGNGLNTMFGKIGTELNGANVPNLP